MKNLLTSFAMIIFLTVFAQANTVSGLLHTPGGALAKDATLSFALNQSGIVAGSFAIVPSPDTCGTDTAGNVVGITRPLVAPVVTTSTASGTVPSGTYYTSITYFRYNSQAMPNITMITETQAGPSATSLLTSAGHLTVTGPTLQPGRANGYRVYVGTSPTALHLQASTVGFGNTTVSSYNSGAAAPLTSNNTVCDLQFNDSIIPSFTFYRVQLTLASNASAPGFPQNWYLAGSTVDVSTMYPLANVANATRFPTPLLANPSSNAQQSVASPVTLNDYSLTAGALYLRAQATPPPCTGSTGLIYTNASGVLTFCQNGANVTGMLDWFDPATGSVVGNQFLLNAYGLTDPASGKHALLVYDTTFDGLIIKSRDYSAVVNKPVKFIASSVIMTDKLLVNLASTDGVLDGIYSGGVVGAVNAVSNSTGISMSYNSVSSTVHLDSGITGAGTVRPLAMSMWAPTAAANREFQRYTLLSGTTLVNWVLADQGDGTSPNVTTASTPAFIRRDRDGFVEIALRNESAGTAAQLSLTAGNGTKESHFGHTGMNFTGLPNSGYLFSSSGLFSVVTTRFRGARGADVASANTMTLGLDGNQFLITGATTIQCINDTDWTPGSVITLIFTSNPTIKNNFGCTPGARSMYLNGAVDITTFSASGANTLTLTQNGDGWHEIGRSVY